MGEGKFKLDLNTLLDGTVESLLKVGDLLMLFTQTAIVAFGVPLMLAFFIVVEQHRVMGGIQLFEVEAQAAAFAAWALVLVNLTIGFVIVYRESKAKNRPKDQRQDHAYKPSLRLRARDWQYWLGMGKSWKPQRDTIAHLEVKLSKLIKLSILLLALGGSMRAQIDKVSVQSTAEAIDWQTGITQLLTTSTLKDMITWAAGLVFAFAVVRAVEVLSRYVALRVNDIRADMKRRAQRQPREATVVSGARPQWGDVRSEALAPIKFMRGDKRMYRCPSCGKEMTRQAWSKHGCRFTGELTDVDEIDAYVDSSELVDVGQLVNAEVNAVNGVK